MGVNGRDDLVTVLAFILEVSADQGSHGHDTLGAAAGLEGETVHTGDLTHIFICFMEDLEHTLYSALILERMVLTYQVCQLIVYLGAVLNSTCTLADLDIHIGAQCLLCQSGIMA